jgi:DNA-binding response OmpR family regulator
MQNLLLLDNGHELADRLRQEFADYELEIHQAKLTQDALSSAQSLPADIVVIVGEAKAPEGLSLCNRAKRSIQVPVIVVTQSLSPQILEQHQKLRGHADAYFDRRQQSEVELVKLVDGLVGLSRKQSPDPLLPKAIVVKPT